MKTELTARIEAVEQRVQQSLNEQVVKIDSKFREQHEYTTRETKEHIKQLAEQWNEKFKIMKQEQDLKNKDLNERILDNTHSTKAVSYTHLDVYKRQI